MNEKECSGRREFLVKSTAIVGGLMLSLGNLKSADAAEIVNDPANEMTVKIDASNPLNKVGGTYTFKYKDEPVIVLRKSETEFAAFSAICPHKGGPIKFNDQTQKFVCDWHNSQFDTSGQRVSGPAKQPLSSYETDRAVVVTFKA